MSQMERTRKQTFMAKQQRNELASEGPSKEKVGIGQKPSKSVHGLRKNEIETTAALICLCIIS